MKVPILMYHMVCETDYADEKRYCCHPNSFARQMSYMSKAGYNVISLKQLIGSFINGNLLPRKPVVITFDDGYKDIYDNAFPILKKYKFPATVFVVSGFLGKTNEWMSKEGHPKHKLLSLDELKEMNSLGIDIGSHTTTHPHLTELPREHTATEIVNSKKELEAMLNVELDLFVYPYGDFNETVKNDVKQAGYIAACSSKSGFNGQNEDLFALRRTAVHGTDYLWQFALKLAFGTNKATISLPMRYYFSKIWNRST